MGKYICLCGETFKKKTIADNHVTMWADVEISEPYPRHKVFIQHWQARLAKWALNYPWLRLMRFAGAYMIYFVLIRHFHIEWSIWEATLIGLGMGLYIE